MPEPRDAGAHTSGGPLRARTRSEEREQWYVAVTVASSRLQQAGAEGASNRVAYATHTLDGLATMQRVMQTRFAAEDDERARGRVQQEDQLEAGPEQGESSSSPEDSHASSTTDEDMVMGLVDDILENERVDLMPTLRDSIQDEWEHHNAACKKGATRKVEGWCNNGWQRCSKPRKGSVAKGEGAPLCTVGKPRKGVPPPPPPPQSEMLLWGEVPEQHR